MYWICISLLPCSAMLIELVAVDLVSKKQSEFTGPDWGDETPTGAEDAESYEEAGESHQNSHQHSPNLTHEANAGNQVDGHDEVDGKRRPTSIGAEAS